MQIEGGHMKTFVSFKQYKDGMFEDFTVSIRADLIELVDVISDNNNTVYSLVYVTGHDKPFKVLGSDKEILRTMANNNIIKLLEIY